MEELKEYLITLTIVVEDTRAGARELADLMKDELEHAFNGGGDCHISVHDVEVNG
jgi:hypothetical protein